jgi:hypothetical protein
MKPPTANLNTRTARPMIDQAVFDRLDTASRSPARAGQDALDQQQLLFRRDGMRPPDAGRRTSATRNARVAVDVAVNSERMSFVRAAIKKHTRATAAANDPRDPKNYPSIEAYALGLMEGDVPTDEARDLSHKAYEDWQDQIQREWNAAVDKERGSEQRALIHEARVLAARRLLQNVG